MTSNLAAKYDASNSQNSHSSNLKVHSKSAKTITLLGSNSGRNLGDAAILASALDILSKEMPGSKFYVPTTHPGFTNKNYGKRYNTKGVNVMPWTGSIRLLGIPTFYCLARSHAALICDGIIFGKQLFNPLFNFLITLIFLAPWARLVGCKLVCYNCGIGPFHTPAARLFARWLMNSCDLILLRDEDSIKLAKSIGVTKPIHLTGDTAFLNEVSSDDRAKEIAKAEGIDLSKNLLGVNVTKYLDSWLSSSESLKDKDSFIDIVSAAINEAVANLNDNIEVVVFCTQPMDETFLKELSQRVKAKFITNTKYLSHDIQAIMKQCKLFLGMRFHSLVLASAVGAPIVGLVYAPKVRSLLARIKSSNYCIELSKLNKDILSSCLQSAWEEKENLKIKQQAIIDGEREGAHTAAKMVRELLSENQESR